MSAPRRSLGPVIAYLLTLLGLVLGGIWLWKAVHTTPAPHAEREAHVAPGPGNVPAAHAAPRQSVATPPSREEFSAAERQQLDSILRRKPAAGKR